jgi:hypothetical protein
LKIQAQKWAVTYEKVTGLGRVKYSSDKRQDEKKTKTKKRKNDEEGRKKKKRKKKKAKKRPTPHCPLRSKLRTTKRSANSAVCFTCWWISYHIFLHTEVAMVIIIHVSPRCIHEGDSPLPTPPVLLNRHCSAMPPRMKQVPTCLLPLSTYTLTSNML